MKVKSVSLALIALCIVCVTILYIHQVPKNITKQDKKIITSIVSPYGLLNGRINKPTDFDAQMKEILIIQDAVFQIAPIQGKIGANKSREPADLLKKGQGECYDRARTLDKALRFLGYETRHAAIYGENDEHFNPMKILTTAGGNGIRSHAVTEVKTAKGWMVIGTVKHWVALDKDNNVYDLKAIDQADTAIIWSNQNKDTIYGLINPLNDFSYIYGLYSRGGRHYKPYNPIPDIYWPEALYNF